GVLQEVGSDQWKVCGSFLTPQSQSQHRELLSQYPDCEAELTLLRQCASRLAEVLGGECDPLQLIFPAESTHLVERVYQDSPVAQAYNILVRDSIRATIAGLPADRTLRVLELGAGTGGTTAHILSVFPSDRTEYVFSDVSPLFLAKAKEKFREAAFLRFKLLDIEGDVEQQGFESGQFDLIIAANVIHATVDLRQSLRNINKLLLPDGQVLLLEVTLRQRWLDLVFGLTEGWWRFQDFDVRPSHPLIAPSTW